MLQQVRIEELNAMNHGTMMQQLGIEYTELGNDYLCARMPVDHRTRQPAGLLHGGASAALAESLGSVGSVLLIDNNIQTIIGIEINANHLRKVKEGFVYGKAILVANSRKLHVWEIRITDDKQRLVCLSRLTVMVIDKK
ncbi:MAG: hotdog fold thioesterase [Bacteroidales bacterium]|nr:hotdog fold thioesterase [Bacteroidales bacterium]MDZ4205048.1 hotdog fold thioesterase [Bacteroidales bacterium]